LSGDITDRQILQDFEQASQREWLATNGIGGYASGSLSGANTRRYHGLLVAALTPPTGRRCLLSKVEETLLLNGETFELSANRYPGAIHPQGYRWLERFQALPAPAFLYRPRPDTLLEKRIWMPYGRNTVCLRYALRKAPAPLLLRLSPLVCWKDYHSEMHFWKDFPAQVCVLEGETRLQPTTESPMLRLLAPGTRWEPAGYWHYRVEHPREQERGFDYLEDLYCPGHFLADLAPGASLTLIATLEECVEPPEVSWRALRERQESLILRAHASDDLTRALTLAADAFLMDAPAVNRAVCRPEDDAPRLRRSTVIAGYHWFTDWGRDTMIALPGLCLATGRHDVARDILTSYAAYFSEGMLPNRFPDQGETPEYNAVDAALWFFHALDAYVRQTEGGWELARELWGVLKESVDWHLRGTRYGVRVDPADGLLHAGVPGVQLTWMDARIGERVVTPRIGKPVEINALWYHALCIMKGLAQRLGEDPQSYARLASRTAKSFRKAFVRPDGQGLYDVIGAEGPDASIRPNQIFAVSLPHSPLTAEQQRAVVETVERHLLTPCGLRTLSPEDPAYVPRYRGSPQERDAAYHQGTVWAWLLGAFVDAHLKVYREPQRARVLLSCLPAHLQEAGVGYCSEIFDADPPHTPDGCIAQAWSVAELLRAWRRTSG
jgi:predicted glycogen debranching enzyme